MVFEWVKNCESALLTRKGGAPGRADSESLSGRLPSPKMEDWLYTDVKELFGGDWGLAEVPSEALAKSVGSPGERKFARDVIVKFVNGNFFGVEGAIDGVSVEVQGFKDTLERGVADFSDCQDVFGDGEEALVELAGLLCGGVVKLHVSGQKKARIEIVHAACEGHVGRVSADCLQVIVEEAASAVVLERFVDFGNQGNYLRMAKTQVQVEKGATVEWVKDIREGTASRHYGVFHGRVEEDGELRVLVASMGGGMIRSDSSIVMLGKRAKAGLHGVTVADGKMRVDNSTMLDHRVPECESRELFRGVYRGSSRGAFTGKVRVHKDAQKTNAFQQNNALMLSDDAEFSSRPVLQIWADDVKCTHGATVGAVDEDALRYMRARGIGRTEAEELLERGFLAEVYEGFELSY